MGNVSSSEIETTLDGKMSLIFDLLGDQFSEDDLLGEVLASHDDVGLARARRKKQGGNKNDENVKDPARSRQLAARQGRGTLGIWVNTPSSLPFNQHVYQGRNREGHGFQPCRFSRTLKTGFSR